VSEGEERFSGWVLEHPGRAMRWVRAATILISFKAADVSIYLRGWLGKSEVSDLSDYLSLW
jgi:hypothetical protein